MWDVPIDINPYKCTTFGNYVREDPVRFDINLDPVRIVYMQFPDRVKMLWHIPSNHERDGWWSYKMDDCEALEAATEKYMYEVIDNREDGDAQGADWVRSWQEYRRIHEDETEDDDPNKDWEIPILDTMEHPLLQTPGLWAVWGHGDGTMRCSSVKIYKRGSEGKQEELVYIGVQEAQAGPGSWTSR